MDMAKVPDWGAGGAQVEGGQVVMMVSCLPSIHLPSTLAPSTRPNREESWGENMDTGS